MIAEMLNMRFPTSFPKWLLLALSHFSALFVACSQAADAAKPLPATEASKEKPAAGTSGDLVPLNLKLPAPAFKGTPKDIQTNTYTDPYPDKPRPPLMVP